MPKRCKLGSQNLYCGLRPRTLVYRDKISCPCVKILGIIWKDHVTNMEVLSRTGQRRLQNIVAERRLRMASHIIRMPLGRPANHTMSWTPRGSARRRGRPTKTWWSTFKEDLVDRGVYWNSVRAVATNRSRWRTLAAHCLAKDRKI